MRFWGSAAVAVVVIVVSSGCTYAYLDDDVKATCGAFEFEINDHGLDPTGATTGAIVGAVERFADLAGREVTYLGATTATHEAHTSDDPVLVELAWPQEAASHLGFASPYVVAGRYESGYVLLHPGMTVAPSGLVRRIVLHELGHLVGLDDVTSPDELMDPSLPVDDYGPGDFYGIVTTHGGFCS
jgi:hypothetical protein